MFFSPDSSLDFNVHRNIQLAQGLPRRAFTDTHVLEKELRTLWSTEWILAPISGGHEPCQVHPFSLPGLSLLATTDTLGRTVVLPNRCSHQWYPLATVSGLRNALVCPQHGRVFGLDGACASHPGVAPCAQFPRNRDHLRAYKSEREGPLLFVQTGARSDNPPRTKLGSIVYQLKSNWALQEVTAYTDRVVSGNWKLHVGNFLDSAHILRMHASSLLPQIDMSTYRTVLYPHGVLQTVSAIPSAHEEQTGAPHSIFARWWFIFPHLALNVYAWGISVNAWYPTEDPNATRLVCFHLVTDAEAYHARNALCDAMVDSEDVALVGSVARHMHGMHTDRMQFVPGQDEAVHWFHRKVSQYLTSD